MRILKRLREEVANYEAVNGAMIEVLNLDDGALWAGLRVVETRPHGRGFSVFVSGSRETLTALRDALAALTRRREP